jgi:hypothetical protein
MKNQIWILVLSILLLSCKQNLITSLYAFPKKLKEVSGITYIPESKLWVMKIVAMPTKFMG